MHHTNYILFIGKGMNRFYTDGYLNRWWVYVDSFSHLITNVMLFTKLMLMLDGPTAFIAHCISLTFTTPTSEWTPESRRRFLNCISPTLPFGLRNRVLAYL